MATSVSWSVHRLFEQRTDGWTTPDSNSTGTSSVCLPNSTWDFIISIYRAAQRMNCQVCFRSWPSLHPHTCRQHVWWDIPTELKVTVSGSDLSAVRQRKCFRAGRRLTWPAPPHRPPQVTELNFRHVLLLLQKKKRWVICLPFSRCWKPPTLVSPSPHGCWAPAAAQNIDRVKLILRRDFLLSASIMKARTQSRF